ncbi:MAG: hypothetical protein V3V47_00935 [Desulfobacteria bacterium]
MKQRLNIESIAAALSIAVVFTSVGIWVGRQTIQKETNVLNHSYSWVGLWDTDTATYKNLRIQFLQKDDFVYGSYSNSLNAPQEITGRIEAEVEGYSLVGKWEENREGKRLYGYIHFVLLPDGDSFLGSYTRSWEGHKRRYVWSGRRIEK